MEKFDWKKVQPKLVERDLKLENRPEYMKTIIGENKKITGDYDKSLAVKCKNGTYVGKLCGDVLSFKGIPFVGEQPVGKNRWRDPVKCTEDNGVYEAFYYANCPVQTIQISESSSMYRQGEDCLYLNVWKSDLCEDKKKPVMVWIHGGAFQQGGTMDPLYDGHNFVAQNPDVIFVSITYRVTLFGFLNLTYIPGGEEYNHSANLGILDQVAALEWIHDNIAAFGGDPDNVTIFGESAGACSVSLLPTIPAARKFFKRVIAQSGGFAFTNGKVQAKEAADKLLQVSGCKNVEELLQLSADQLREMAKEFVLKIWPERDGVVIPEDPYKTYESGELKDIDFISGNNKDEVLYFVACMGGHEPFVKFFKNMMNENLAYRTEDDRKLVQEVLDRVNGTDTDKMVSYYNATNFYSPTALLLEAHKASGGRAYQYFWTPESADKNLGACHAIEVSAVLNNLDDMDSTQRRYDETFAATVQRMWVKFAKTGDPTLSAEESPTDKAIAWPQYDKENKRIMYLEETGCHAEENVGLYDRGLDPLCATYIR